MEGWIGKNVYVELTSGRKYTGKVIEDSEKLITIIDKYGKIVEITKFSVIMIQEEGRR